MDCLSNWHSLMGLQYVELSIYQMLRGSAMVFVALFKLLVWKVHLVRLASVSRITCLIRVCYTSGIISFVALFIAHSTHFIGWASFVMWSVLSLSVQLPSYLLQKEDGAAVQRCSHCGACFLFSQGRGSLLSSGCSLSKV